MATKVGRNDPCPCGSGKKSKLCHPDSTIIAYTIKLHISHGVPGIDDRTDNPVARATRNLMAEGQRFTSAAHAIMIHNGLLRWVGMFVLSAAQRIVFFPGFAAPFDRVAAHGDPKAAYDVDFALDHVTLDSDRRSWHLTQKVGGKRNRPAGKTLDVGDGRILWFGMTTSEPWEFRPVASEIVARADAPSNNAELQNRIATFNQAVGGAQAVDIQLPPPPKAARLALHLVATVARPGAPLYAGPQLCFPPTIGTPEPATADARAGLLRLSRRKRKSSC